ncbi:MAP7 domain-containing protein 3 [Pteronotus mesoamericanus]|uniref:MAP7 domain-containing protein 3 n=1 Tax=Pteronotus mesoamericanus TaxID=1884717 RepID=UPI0023EB2DC5|nr:MAP7 domain-containing protein 3 [Pteronotus parnellii mesoamericanus]
MAERASSDGCTSLRGMRERMVAAARAIAQERRNQNELSMPSSQSSNARSAFKPVIDGSVLKNDIRQKLAKERREEKRRQQDATKELQLLEKERKSKIQYEKQMEEKQRKLREQKQKDEQRRISAEEKRKQKLQEEREKFKAVVSRTLERSNRIEQRQKRWSWEGSTTLNSESKMVNKRFVSTEKLEQETCGSHKQKTVSSSSLQNSIAKKEARKKGCLPLNRRYSKLHSPTEAEQVEGKSVQQLYTDIWENDLIMRLITPTKASIARSKSAASLSVSGKDTPGVHNPVMRYTHMPLLSLSSDELKNTAVLCKSTAAIPPQEKEETPLKVNREASPEASMEAAPKGILEVSPETSVEVAPEASVEVPFRASMEATPKGSVEAFPEVSVDTLSESVETSPVGSEDVSLVSVDPSPEVSMDSSSEVSFDSSPEVSMEPLPEASMDVFHKASMDTIPEESLETILEEIIEVPAKESVEVTPESRPEVSVESSSKVTVRDTPQKSNSNRKSALTQAPFSRWPSSASEWCSPYPFSANRQIQKNQPPSFSPVVSKQSAQPALSCKAIPVQHDIHAPKVLGTIRRKKEAVSKTTDSSEAVSQKHMTYEESDNKSTQGILSAEEATHILTANRNLAREQREKEEKLQKEVEQRKKIDVAKKEVEGQEVFSKFGSGQRQKKIKKKKGCQDQEKQKVLLQKEDTKAKVQEEADKRKKEQEKIMLRNLQERLERKKRIEEIIKRTRKTNSNASKVAQTSRSDMYEEHEADDEDESESDDVDYFDDFHPPACVSGLSLATKLKANFRNVKNTPRLLFLDINSDKVHPNIKTSLKSDTKTFRQKVKRPLAKAKAKGIRLSTKRMTNQVTKTGKAGGTSKTVEPPRNLHSMSQECRRDEILDITSETEPLVSDTLPDSQKHHLKGSTTSQQSPQIPLDDKNGNKSDSASSDM